MEEAFKTNKGLTSGDKTRAKTGLMVGAYAQTKKVC